jgi:hypothetical protein
MTELPNKTPNEFKTLTFNFAPDLAPGVTIFNPTFTKSLLRSDLGTSVLGAGFAIPTPPAVPDIGAAALVIGANQVVGQTLLVLVGGGLDGNHYKIVAEVVCSDSQTLDNAAVFAVYDSAA